MEEFALPSKPPPTAQPAYGVPSSSLTADRLNARDDLLRKYMQGQPYVLQNGSVRSAGGSTVTADSIDLEKGILGVEMPEGREPRRSKKKHRREMSERHDERRSDRSPPVQHSHGTHEQMEEEQEILLEQKSLKLLVSRIYDSSRSKLTPPALSLRPSGSTFSTSHALDIPLHHILRTPTTFSTLRLPAESPRADIVSPCTTT